MDVLSIVVLVIVLLTLLLNIVIYNKIASRSKGKKLKGKKPIIPPGALWSKEELKKLEEYHNKGLKHLDMLKKKYANDVGKLLFEKAIDAYDYVYEKLKSDNPEIKRILLITEHNASYVVNDKNSMFTIITGETFNKPVKHKLAYFLHPAALTNSSVLVLPYNENIHGIPSEEFEKSIYSINENGEKVITIVELDNIDGGIIDVVINDVYPK